MAGGAQITQQLIDAAIDGDVDAIARLNDLLTSARAERDGQSVDAVLSPLARHAGQGSEMAMALLLDWILQLRLAHRAVGRVLVDPDDVDDAVQESMVAVTRGVVGFEGRARFTTWLHTVAHNAALRIVQRKAKGGVPTDDVPDPAAVPGAIRRMSSMVATRQAVERALAQLPTHYRAPLVMREFDQLSYEEIAERLDVPIGTVRSRIARGRQQIGEHLRG